MMMMMMMMIFKSPNLTDRGSGGELHNVTKAIVTVIFNMSIYLFICFILVVIASRHVRSVHGDTYGDCTKGFSPLNCT